MFTRTRRCGALDLNDRVVRTAAPSWIKSWPSSPYIIVVVLVVAPHKPYKIDSTPAVRLVVVLAARTIPSRARVNDDSRE
jgi:hypothetical protein